MTDSDKAWAVALKAMDNADARAEQLASLAADPAKARAIFEALIHGNVDQQEWVIELAPRVLGRESADLLEELMNNGVHVDVRDAALSTLAKLDPQRIRAILPRVRGRLASHDFFSPVTATWVLARAHDTASIPKLVELSTDPNRPLVRYSAQAALMLLRDQTQELAEAIASHDHLRMPWLAVAAQIDGSQRSRDALALCAERAPDQECRGTCSRELTKLTRRGLS